MSELIDLTGKRFERLTVIGRNSVNGKQGQPYWDCICECGKGSRVMGQNLRKGKVKSCGCLSRDKTAERNRAVSYPTHARSWTCQYRTWVNVKSRCYNPNATGYKDYGGRGIKMYYRWKDDPEAFCDWLDRFLGPRPEGYSLDRINNDGDYEPRNLRWADAKTQQNNKRTSK